ncbi:MAG: AmpE protein, partial [Gammaproteobacteria bacterium]
MTLISILLGLALEYFMGPMDRFRNFQWFENYLAWLELKSQNFSFWDGVVGVLTTIAIPIACLILLDYILAEIFIGLSFILSILIFVYCLGPDLSIVLSNYSQALEGNIEEDIAVIETSLELNSDKNDYKESLTISSILIRSHEYMFGVLFWYIVLGMAGALLFSLVLVLNRKYQGVHGGYASSVQDLHKILIWPSSRLLALAFALSGSLVDTLDRWRKLEGESLNISQEIISESGLGALQYDETAFTDDEEVKAKYIQCIKETQALINRSLIVWLTILG